MGVKVGEQFGEYIIIKPLATGGMAQVYLARKQGLAGFTKLVAIKIILPQFASNQQFINMFLYEARLAVGLTHANIAEIMDLGEVDGRYFIAMEYANGMDLQQITKKARKSGKLFPLPYAAKVCSLVAEGLYYAHTKADPDGRPLDIVHRDVSPHNVILTYDGIPKLIDFGIAKASVTYKEDDEGILKGKFSYMSPEQVRGMPLDPRSDIFALGIVLWEVCTGANLYRESSELLTMEAILSKPVPYPRELRGDMPPELELIILKALAKSPDERFQTAHEMHLALEGYLNHAGWSVGAQHLSEFMHRLFPEEVHAIGLLLEQERKRAEQEERALAASSRPSAKFVPWEPYEHIQSESRSPEIEEENGTLERQTGPIDQPAPAVAQDRRRSGWFWPILIVLLLLAGGIAATLALKGTGEHAGAGDAQQRVLSVESEPAGAAVSIDGRPVGVTPMEFLDFAPGEDLTLRLEKEGYQVYVLSVRPSASRPRTIVRARLQPNE